MSNNANIDDFRWLVGSEAARWLEEASAEARRPGFPPVRLAARLREQLSPEKAHLVLEQVELRDRGRDKFARAESMFFARVGLEQATDELVAAHKAARFLAKLPVADLCCGIGGDAIALAERGDLVAMDRDPVALILAEANLKGITTASVQRQTIDANSIAELRLGGFSAWHIDPDRRPAGHRTTKVELHEPGVDVLRALLAANPSGAVKLAPGAEFAEAWWNEAELEWISRGRQCRQLMAWFGKLAKSPGMRRATVLAGQLGEPPQVAGCVVGVAEMECEFADRIGRYVYEPDAAVLAAKLEGALAQQHALAEIAGGIAYFTADYLVTDGALAAFEVLEAMPYDVRRLKAWLSERQFGRLEVKKRGVPIEPDEVRRKLQNRGEESATILLARVAGQITAVVTRRIALTSTL